MLSLAESDLPCWKGRFQFLVENGVNGSDLNSSCERLLFPFLGTEKGISVILCSYRHNSLL